MTRLSVAVAASLLARCPPLTAQKGRVPDQLVVLTFDDSKASHYTVVPRF